MSLEDDMREAVSKMTYEQTRLTDLYVLEQGPFHIERTEDGARFVAKQDIRLRLKEADELRAEGYEQGQRDVFALHTEWTVTGMCKPGCLPCQRLTELITERSKGYEEGVIAGAAEGVKAGRSGAIADAVAAVERLRFRPNTKYTTISDAIRAIKAVGE